MGSREEPRGQASFGQLLRSYREAAGLTQEEMAERVELSVRGLRYLEHGLRRPYRETARRVADALHLPAQDVAVLLAAARSPSVPSESATSSFTGHDLPIPPSPLVGREREIGVVTNLLRGEDVRVLTLTGPGGVGKTRLALEVAARLQPSFADGVVWIPLAALTDPRMVPAAIAQAVGLAGAIAHPVPEALTSVLRDQQVLLLLDNFEHLADAAAVLSDLVSACPRLKVLVTSRAALRLRAEHEFPVAPLRPPGEADPISIDSLAGNPAVDLFLRRAQAAKPDFALTEANAAAVAAICRRLEGLPLALELAAARIRVLPPTAMLRRLEHRLSFLSGGGVDLPVRQRTMREAIAWSYDLLPPAEQTLFRRLAVFAGGCDIAAVEAVCGAGGETSLDVLAALESLLRNSLPRLVEDTGEEPRFAMLETIREYALELLVASREEDEVRHRHAQYYLACAEETRRVYRPFEGPWLDWFGREYGNLRAALRWSMERREAETSLRLGAALWMYWYVSGDPGEGRALLAAVLTLPGATTMTAARAECLLGAGQLAMTQGDYSAARILHAGSIALSRALHNDRATSEALFAAGFVARVQEEYETARPLLEEALALARACGHQYMIAASLHHLGMMAADARSDDATARSFFEESLDLYRALGYQRHIALVLRSLGDVARAQGEYALARQLLQESLTTMVAAGEKLGIGGALDAFARLAADEGQVERAVQLAGAAAWEREMRGTHAWPVDERRREALLAAAREVLGDEAYQRARAQGKAMSREQAIALARDVTAVEKRTTVP